MLQYSKSETASNLKYVIFYLIISNFHVFFFCCFFFCCSFALVKKRFSYRAGLTEFHPWPLAVHQTWGQREGEGGGEEDGWKDARQRTGGDGGSGQIPSSPGCAWVTSQKRCCSPEGRVALPESLWHLLQVLVSVGFKLHIFKRGRVIRISMNTPNIMQHRTAGIRLEVQNVGARAGVVGSSCRAWPQTTQTFFLYCMFDELTVCSVIG